MLSLFVRFYQQVSIIHKVRDLNKNPIIKLTFCFMKFLCLSMYRICPRLFFSAIPAEHFTLSTCEFLEMLKQLWDFSWLPNAVQQSKRQKEGPSLLFPFVNTTIFSFPSLTLFPLVCLSQVTPFGRYSLLPFFLSNAACMAKLPKHLLYSSPSERYGFTREVNLLWFLFGNRYIRCFLSYNSGKTQLFNLLSQYPLLVSLNEVTFICVP